MFRVAYFLSVNVPRCQQLLARRLAAAAALTVLWWAGGGSGSESTTRVGVFTARQEEAGDAGWALMNRGWLKEG